MEKNFPENLIHRVTESPSQEEERRKKEEGSHLTILDCPAIAVSIPEVYLHHSIILPMPEPNDDYPAPVVISPLCHDLTPLESRLPQ